MTDFFPQIEIFRKCIRGGIIHLKIGLPARTHDLRTHIFFLVRRNLLSPGQKKNRGFTSQKPCKPWVIVRFKLNKLSDLILEGLNNG